MVNWLSSSDSRRLKSGTLRDDELFLCFSMVEEHSALFEGTDDDLPPSHQNKVPRAARIARNGRSGLGSVPHPRMHTDMEAKIDNLEQDAYSSVLRAFKAQSDAITWVFGFTLFEIFMYNNFYTSR
ncbi:hypothetical protein L1049_020333 [Liquidambar formosana]|uniref:ENT domain-containing protein n=1 Tax=Liquidambar formosana TaxID=63359 RepID=A0AAP0SCZ4_LIQFO